MELIKTVDQVPPLPTGLPQEITLQEYLQFLEVLASKTNINNDWVKTDFIGLNNKLHDLLADYKDSYADLLKIATFDIALLNTNLLNLDHRDKIRLVAKICTNEALLNSRKTDELDVNYKEIFIQQINTLLATNLSIPDLEQFYDERQLAKPSINQLNKLLNHYSNNIKKAHHHYEKDPELKRPHKRLLIHKMDKEAGKI